jgi:peptide/nickel transport system permease protein
MGALIIRRIATLIPTLLIVSFLVFSMVLLQPGDPAVEIAGGVDASEENILRVQEEYGFNDPFITRYWDWVTDAVQGDFGESYRNSNSVTDEIKGRLPKSASLAAAGLVFGTTLGLGMGMLAGMFPGTKLDRGLMSATVFGIAIPNFVLAMVLISVVSIQWGFLDLPPLGYTTFDDPDQGKILFLLPKEWVRSLILPGFALGLSVAASTGRQLRGALADTMASNFIRTAWAKGGSTRTVVGKHALKNALIPAVTVLGLQISALLGGTVLIERIFSIEGLGRLVLVAASVAPADLPVVQGVAMLFVLINVTVSLLVDIVYGYLDPRVRVS